MEKIVSVNKVSQFYLILKEQILSGKYKLGDKLPSIRDFAKMYGISKTTVNTVISMLVNNGLLKVKDGMGTYVSTEPNDVKPIGIMLFDFTTSMRIDTDILSHIQRNISTNYYLNIIDTSNRYDVFIEGLQRCKKNGLAGLIITPPKVIQSSSCELGSIRTLIKGSMPVVFVIREIEGMGADFFSVDLSKGIYKAFEYFNALNKKRTAIIKHDSEKFVNEEIKGLLKAQAKFNIEIKPQWIIDWSDNIEIHKKQIFDILPEIDSLIAPDNVLYQLQDIIRESGKNIPDDLSIVAINDTAYSKMFYRQLTSIAYPVERIGLNAITTLIDRIEKRLDGPPIRKNFTPELIVRGS